MKLTDVIRSSSIRSIPSVETKEKKWRLGGEFRGKVGNTGATSDDEEEEDRDEEDE
jgi:hypothetical protein